MTPRQRLDNLINLFVPRIRAAFYAAIQNVVDNVILNQVISAIEAGDLERAFRALGVSDAALRPITASLESVFEEGGVATGATFPRYLNTSEMRLAFHFDVRNRRAEEWLRQQSSELVTRISNETRNNVRTSLESGMIEGRNPRNVALDIVGRIDPATGKRTGGVIGLTENQQFWAQSARNRLLTLNDKYFTMELRDKRFDRTVAKAISENKPLPIETVDKLIARYRDNALKFRGDTIARTEAVQSLNRSEWEATKQVVDMGAVSQSAVQREWDDVGDRRTRWSHRQMNGQRVGLDEPFVSPSGASLMFPGDTSLGAPGAEVVNCRCRVRSVIDWLDGVT
jgi:hypothetical protein